MTSIHSREMKVIASILALSSATTCPNAAWEYDSVNSVCIPAADSDFAFTCNSAGTISIDFKLEHLYSNVANSFLTEAQTALTNDGAVGPTNDVYTYADKAMTFSQASADKIVGTFVLAVRKLFVEINFKIFRDNCILET